MFKSPGFFAVFSKNYSLIGNLGFHAGVNRSLEDKDDKDINAFLGMDKSINEDIHTRFEYDFAVNEGGGKDGHFLNAIFVFNFEGIDIELIFKNLLEKQTINNSSKHLRELSISYTESF